MKNPHLRYNGFNEVLRKKFGQKISRLTLNLNLTCPHVDPITGNGGCHYCNDDHLLGKSWHKQLSLNKQIDYGKNYLKGRHNTDKYLAYFQNGTNTNAPTDKLLPLFKESISDPAMVGLIISTRPDCLPDDMIDALCALNSQTWLWVELGLQSTQDHVLDKINRGHSVAAFVSAVERLAAKNIRTCAHIIFGLPDESREEMIGGVHLVNSLPVNGIKLHNLFIVENTVLAQWFKQGDYTPLTLCEYATLCVDYLERLRPDITIHRLNAHAPDRLTIAPKWSVNKWDTLNAVHEEIEKRGTQQGRLYQAPS
ncbi:MAG: TIGR01212 family radical SAM protein [Deltaproteobacteria bacterium]|nr:TIGR01212 family radical SAM protein [Deltaproteobacteria bacterium]